MLEKLKNWLIERFSDDDDFLPEPRGKTGPSAAPKAPKSTPRLPPANAVNRVRKPDQTDENSGTGKQTLIRNKYIREDTGTHETLKILDDSIVDSGEETGIDPYNTGGFDRSKNWSNRFRK